MPSVFLICPVRNASPEATARLRDYVALLETSGHRVHWPARDTPQDDPIGVRICTDNARAMLKAEEVHLWYDQGSQGSIFDFGMFFMLMSLIQEVGMRPKRFVLANPDAVQPTDGSKSFQNVIRAMAGLVDA